MKRKRKTQDGAQCPMCKEKIFSEYRHDMRYCSCGYCYVDGGLSYLRMGWGGDKFEQPWVIPKTVRRRINETIQKANDSYECRSRWPY